MVDTKHDSKPDSKDGSTSFFRKVVKFVANPATDWTELTAPPEEPIQNGYAKSELKAMIERKRRNDFVRKREFDMLRKIRREGLPADGLSGMQGTSDLDDSDQPRSSVARPDDAVVKAKIDEIEQQMDGEVSGRRSQITHTPSFYTAPTAQGRFDEQAPALNQPFSNDAPSDAGPDTQPSESPAAASALPSNALAWDSTLTEARAASASPVAAGPTAPALASSVSASPIRGPALGPAAATNFGGPLGVEINDVAPDPELDEAVISFANAEFEACERSINELISSRGTRSNHAETWLVLFDLYRATGQQMPFESLALDYVQRFGWSAPQWFSIPQLVAAAEAQSGGAARGGAVRVEGNVGWIAPGRIDVDAVTQLRAKTLQMPMPWVLDWSPVASIELDACSDLIRLLHHWSTQAIQMRWMNSERVLTVLAEAAPTGSRDADPVLWLLRLEMLRMSNRPDQFDEVAIDYCVTYEVSPPSWERPLSSVKRADTGGVTLNSRAMVTEISTGFAESQVLEETGGIRSAAVELSGQLVGDISDVLRQLEAKLGGAGVVNINCSRLIRMDFLAAGDLLNWVLNRRTENRLVHFDETHRLLGLFFNAMGISEHARVRAHTV